MRSKKNSSNRDKDGGSHPQENRPEHRHFLVRSLERNDTDLSALVELNRSLHQARAKILQSCGEIVLLDLGVGRLTLINDELHEEKSAIASSIVNDKSEYTKGNSHEATKEEEGCDASSKHAESKDFNHESYSLTPAQKDLCVDFLLRMKLRCKLANRLARRLNRIAQAMDGSDVNPPIPPRYGDLRLNIDPLAVEAHSQHWKRQEAAKKTIEQARMAERLKRQQELLKQHNDKKEKQRLKDSEMQQEGQADATVESSSEPLKPSEEKPSEVAPDVQNSSTIESTSASTPTTETKQESSAVSKEGGDQASSTDKVFEEPTPMDVDSSNAAPSTNLGPKPTPSADTTPQPVQQESEEKAGQTKKDLDAVVSSGATQKKTDGSTPVDGAAKTLPQSNTALSSIVKDSPPSLQEEYDLLRQYENSYEKVWDHQLKAFKYVIAADENFVPDYMSIKAGAAIGAQIRILSEQEREQEYKRWQAALLARIPHQPTFEELGLKNRVFCLDGRRKRCLEETTEVEEEPEEEASFNTKNDKDGEPATKKLKTAEDGSPNGEDNKQSDDSENGELESKEVGEDSESLGDDELGADTETGGEPKENCDEEDRTGEEDEEPANAGKDIGKVVDTEISEKKAEAEKKTIKLEPRKKKEEEQKKQAEAAVDEPKRIRPMSLAAVPSFYDQDLMRIRTVHGDLLGTSILEHARRRMAEATNEYNNALRISSQIFDHRNRLQQNLAYFLTKSRADIAKVNSDHAFQVARAKAHWVKQKKEHDVRRVKQFFPSNWGRVPFGTQATQNYQRRGGVASVVGACLGDIVDGAFLLLEGKVPNKKFDDFVPPPPPRANKQTGETLAQQNLRMENELRRQLHELNAKFTAGEEQRKLAWKKMMKTKGDIELPSAYSGRRGRVDASNYHNLPMPALRQSTQQIVPQELAARAAVATYTPARTTGFNGIGGSDSKYSAARVRERISTDGSVAPVTEPKKTKDGLYMRPAGRTRKGMQWDAMRGIWVPEG